MANLRFWKYALGWGDGPVVRSTQCFSRGPSSILHICIRQLRTACSSSNRASDPLLASTGKYTRAQS